MLVIHAIPEEVARGMVTGRGRGRFGGPGIAIKAAWWRRELRTTERGRESTDGLLNAVAALRADLRVGAVAALRADLRVGAVAALRADLRVVGFVCCC